MFKMLGALLIITACSSWGFYLANSFKLRPVQLRTLLSAFNLLETEISYASTPLPMALEKIAKHVTKPVNILLLKTKEELLQGDGITANEAWSKAIDYFKAQAFLDEEDLQILREFGAGLGNSDKVEQLKNLQLTKELIREQQLKAEVRRQQNERIWKTMGVLAGVALVLIMF